MEVSTLLFSSCCPLFKAVAVRRPFPFTLEEELKCANIRHTIHTTRYILLFTHPLTHHIHDESDASNHNFSVCKCHIPAHSALYYCCWCEAKKERSLLAWGLAYLYQWSFTGRGGHTSPPSLCKPLSS